MPYIEYTAFDHLIGNHWLKAPEGSYFFFRVFSFGRLEP